MAILDVFKKPKKTEKKPVKKIEPKKVEKTVKKAEPKKPIKKRGEAFKVLASPHVTEKATDLEKDNKYTFKVFKNTNKQEVKKAVEGLYGVNVEEVNIINIPKKKRRTRTRREGWRKGYKKAIVKVQKGQKIEVMPR